MKTTSLAILTILILSGFAEIKYVQYYKVESINTTQRENEFIFENDTVRITYSFWSNGGVMAFTVFNKLDKPLYIDWQRSALIINADNNFYFNDSMANEGYLQKTVGFLPPKTQLKQSLDGIVKKNISEWSNYETQYQTRNDSKKEQTKIFAKKFSPQTSPVIFRNYLTLSDKPEFDGLFSIDNGFYIGELDAMDVRNFRHDKGNNMSEYYYYKGTDFYLEK